MILYYAVGGGLGHLSRARKVLDKLKITNFMVITGIQNNPVFDPSRSILIENKDTNTLQSELRFWTNKASILIVDTFPNGVLGELSNQELSIPIWYIARSLDMHSYGSKLQPAPLDRTFVMETLPPLQAAFVQKYSKKIETMALQPLKNPKDSAFTSKQPFWLVHHSGPIEEVMSLYAYAKDIAVVEKKNPKIVINTQCAADLLHAVPAVITHFFPIHQLLVSAEKIITACGFNTMSETEPFAYKHHFLPFERKYDDQFTRAKIRNQKQINKTR